MHGRSAVVTGALVLVAGVAVLVRVAEPGEASATVQAEQAGGTARLAWIAGCWQRGSGAVVIEEQWMRPRGGAMMGMARTVRRDTAVAYEHLRIFDRGGRTVYAALPSGQAMTEFETATTTDSLVTFENPAHDFPQRIIYRRRGADSLVARIEGMRGGQPAGVDFPFRRVAC